MLKRRRNLGQQSLPASDERSDSTHIALLKTLRYFLGRSFAGATIGDVKIDDCVKSLDWAIERVQTK